MSRKKGHWMTINWWARYTVCPTCGYVLRNKADKPLIHKGGKP